MEFEEEGERIAFGCVAKGHKKYGSTSRFRRKDPKTFVYKVQKGDTMQGIAVKFGVTTEQIRRTNQMWTNDSLFLRDTLLIPCTKETDKSLCENEVVGKATNSTDSDSDTEVKSGQENTRAHPSSSLSTQQEATTAV